MLPTGEDTKLLAEMSSVTTAGASTGPSESPYSSGPGTRGNAPSQSNWGNSHGVEQPYDPVRPGSPTSLGPGPDATGRGSPEGLRGRRVHGNHQNPVRPGRTRSVSVLHRTSLASQLPGNVDYLDRAEKGDQKPYAADVSAKLGTVSGVFVPTALNVLSILMFLRFGFILGQSGVLGMMGQFTSFLSLPPSCELT